jgi:hypothetical protein
MYSIAFNKLTAQVKFGVHGSNLSGNQASLKHDLLTHLIAQPQEKIGLNSVSNFSFHHKTQIQVFAIILCHVKNKKSQLSFFTSNLK